MQKDYTKIDEEFNKEFLGNKMLDLVSSQNAQKYRDFIHKAISLSEQSLLERVEKEIPKEKEIFNKIDEEDNKYWRANRNHNIGYNLAIKEVKKILTSLKHLPQEEVKNK